MFYKKAQIIDCSETREFWYQTDGFSCAPVALLNLIEWTSKGRALQDPQLIFDLCQTDTDGTSDVIFDRLVRMVANVHRCEISTLVNKEYVFAFLSSMLPNQFGLLSHDDGCGEMHWSSWTRSRATKNLVGRNVDTDLPLHCYFSQKDISKILEDTHSEDLMLYTFTK